MNIGIVGLGKMGHAIAKRVITHGEMVYGFDLDKQAKQHAHEIGVQLVDTITQLPTKTDLIWLMLPAGEIVDNSIKELLPHLKPDSIIVDGGNSYFKDSIRRAELLLKHNVYFLDCGTSGGLKGEEIGFSLMIGGKNEPFQRAQPLLRAIAANKGYGLVGPSGTGHYVKMIHNGIEYALMQAYAEGFHLLKEGSFKNEQLNLAQITHIWSHGSIIRSYLLDLSHDIFQADQSLDTISGYIAESGMGQWTLDEAVAQHIAIPTIADALDVRAQSRTTGGNFATKVVAMLRNKFGGHAVKKE